MNKTVIFKMHSIFVIKVIYDLHNINAAEQKG